MHNSNAAPAAIVEDLLTVKEASGILRLGRTKIRRDMDRGLLRFMRFGKALRISRQAIAEYQAQAAGASSAVVPQMDDAPGAA